MRIARRGRRGLSLLEVILSLAIFLIALVGLSQLLNISAEQAIQIHRLNRAGQLLQSKMNEVVAGVVPLTGQSESSFDEDPDWSWSMECEGEGTPNLWRVTISVTFKGSDGAEDGPWTLSQLVLDPAARGPASVPAASSSSGSAGPGATTSGTQSSGTTPTGGR